MVSDADLLDKITDYTRKQGGDTAIERLLANVVSQVREFAEARASEIKRLSDIGIALSAERNLERLLERIVDEARRFTRADAGTLYTVQINPATNLPELKFDI
ncbi:MAG TPA: hypothetical protein PLV10_11080, partial [Candidatus Latescibacteria bacterium]|nr:hypothetical protein [Candidatus Latescibacterota bacterium]